MQSILRRLRGLGPVGGTAADILAFITTNWVLTVSTIAGVWASLTDGIVALATNPRFEAGVIFFLAILWTSIGITVLIHHCLGVMEPATSG